MGNDGGSIPLRSEMVKLKGVRKNVAETAMANSEHAWKYCALSRAPLVEPLVSDAFGRLYNKESILLYILDHDAFGDVSKTLPHINSLKDVVELKIAKSADKFICDVTRRDMNGSSKFVYLVPCGHVVAAEALEAIKSEECLICAVAYKQPDVVPLNPEAKDLESLQRRLEGLEQADLTHSGLPMKAKKKKKKRKMVEEHADQYNDRQGKKLNAERQDAVSNAVPAAHARSAVLDGLLHKSSQRVAVDGFMTRGTSSRVG